MILKRIINGARYSAISEKSITLTFKILAENPAYKIFISDPQLRNEYILEVEDVDPELLSKKVLLIFEDFQPDGVLCGVSGPGNGVDECLLKTAHDVGIRRFAFQDYWGFLKFLFQTQCHDMIFVVDKYAKELTNMRTFASVEIVGNPKYDCYKDLDISALQARFWKSTIQTGRKHWIYRPTLSQFIGYLNTLKKCSKIISKWAEHKMLLSSSSKRK